MEEENIDYEKSLKIKNIKKCKEDIKFYKGFSIIDAIAMCYFSLHTILSTHGFYKEESDRIMWTIVASILTVYFAFECLGSKKKLKASKEDLIVLENELVELEKASTK